MKTRRTIPQAGPGHGARIRTSIGYSWPDADGVARKYRLRSKCDYRCAPASSRRQTSRDHDILAKPTPRKNEVLSMAANLPTGVHDSTRGTKGESGLEPVKPRRIATALYQLRSDGSARLVTADQRTPFAVVTFFHPEQELDVLQPLTKSELLAMIEKAINANLFSAVRVDGIFDEASNQAVSSAYRSSQTASRESVHQRAGDLGRISYTRICSGHRRSWFSSSFLAAGQTGRRTRTRLSAALRQGSICTGRGLQVELPTSAEFLKTNFEDQAVSEKIKASEG
jgi:acetolactate decarboxylase